MVRKQILRSQVKAWPKATKAEKGAILDHLCAVNGWHRDHARKMVRRALTGYQPPPRSPRPPRYTYGPEVITALELCWAELDAPTGKVLASALPDLVPNLLAHGALVAEAATVDALLSMSAATVDRRLGKARAGLTVRGTSHTKPGSMLKSSIPQKTWSEWDNTVPGFLQIDLVGHDGGDNNGHFYFTLDATDVATGWTESITVRSKGERIVHTGLTELHLRFPFAIQGIHSDNGSEFINHLMARWCDTHEITFTRGRPAHSNDQAYIEQKNWSQVRRVAGYYRYDTPRELDLLNQIWPAECALNNLFKPQQKLLTKTRQGAKVTKTYDKATTPFRRLLRDHPDYLTDHDKTDLLARLEDLNVDATRRQIHASQATLRELATRRQQRITRRAKNHHVYSSRTKMGPPPKRAKPNESTTHPKRAS